MSCRKTKYPCIRIKGESIKIDFYYKNIRCREYLKMKPTATNLRKAWALLERINDEIKYGVFNYATHFPNSNKVEIFGGQVNTNMTVSEALDWWWEDNQPEHKKNSNAYEGHIKTYIKPCLGNIFLSDLKARQVKIWINSLELSASTKNNILTPLRKLFEEAYSEDLIEKNIMDRVKSITRVKKEKNPLNIYEVDRVLNNFKQPEVQMYYTFAIWSGLSTSEQLGLRWGDINFEEYQISIKHALVDNKVVQTKNSYRTRTIDLLSPAYSALQGIMPKDYYENPKKYQSEYIFINPRTGNFWRNDAISTPWKRNLLDLNIDHRRPYDTRHIFASIMVTACLPDGWVRHQMGHANMEMLSRIYAKWHGDADEVVDWVIKYTKDRKNGAQFNKLFLDLHNQTKSK